MSFLQTHSNCQILMQQLSSKFDLSLSMMSVVCQFVVDISLFRHCTTMCSSTKRRPTTSRSSPTFLVESCHVIRRAKTVTANQPRPSPSLDSDAQRCCLFMITRRNIDAVCEPVISVGLIGDGPTLVCSVFVLLVFGSSLIRYLIVGRWKRIVHFICRAFYCSSVMKSSFCGQLYK